MIIIGNVHLGEAAKLAAPSGTLGQTGYTIFPLSGNKSLIFQWGLIGPSDSSTGIATTSFPMAFPNGASLALVQELTATTTGPIGVNSWGVSETTKTTLTAIVAARTVTSGAAVETGRYFAIGY